MDRGGLVLPSWKVEFGSMRLVGQLSETILQLRQMMRPQDGGTLSTVFGAHWDSSDVIT